MTPDDLIQKKLGLHRAIAKKLKLHPELLSVVRQNIETFRARGNSAVVAKMNAWEAHLDQGLEHVCAKLVEGTEQAHELRTGSPFGGVLTNEERWAYFRRFSADLQRKS